MQRTDLVLEALSLLVSSAEIPKDLADVKP